MFLSLTQTLVLFQNYKYLIIAPIAVLEGPIISIIAGFLISLGLLKGLPTYAILVLGDVIGDSLHYALGRYSNHTGLVEKSRKLFGTENIEQTAQYYFKNHKIKTIFIAKISHGLGGVVQVISGMIRFDYFQFVIWNFLSTLPKSLILLLIGYYAGHSYARINEYLSVLSIFTIAVGVGLVVMYFKLGGIAKKYFVSVDKK